MKTLSLLMMMAMFCGAVAFSADAVDAKKAASLTKANGCLACHVVDGKLVGPSYKDVAAKYHHVKGAEALLMKKVKMGGSGVWGQIPMIPHPGISDADLKTMVDWILTLK